MLIFFEQIIEMHLFYYLKLNIRHLSYYHQYIIYIYIYIYIEIKGHTASYHNIHQ